MVRPGGSFLCITIAKTPQARVGCAPDRPVAEIEIVHGLLDQVAAGTIDVEAPVARGAIVRPNLSQYGGFGDPSPVRAGPCPYQE